MLNFFDTDLLTNRLIRQLTALLLEYICKKGRYTFDSFSNQHLKQALCALYIAIFGVLRGWVPGTLCILLSTRHRRLFHHLPLALLTSQSFRMQP